MRYLTMCEIDEDNIYFYCVKCLSLDIRQNSKGCLYCHHCGADAFKIDVTDFDRWNELYIAKYGHPQIERKTVYDDLAEAYSESAYDVMTADEALANDLIVGNFVNRKIKD